MTPKQARLGVDIFTAAVIASVAIALASLTWRLQGYAGQSAAASPVAPGFTSVDVAPIIALAPFGTATGMAVEGSADGLQLRAVFAATPASASVALIALPDGQVVPFAIGEVTPGGIVESIEPEKVTLRAQSGLRFLGFNPQDGVAAPPSAPITTSGIPAASTPAPAPRPPLSGGAAAIRALVPQPPTAVSPQVPPPIASNPPSAANTD